jgi:hypothetical protein
MAFKDHNEFFVFLKDCARDAKLRVQAAGQNFILEESEALDREAEYLRRVQTARPAMGYAYDSWAVVHKAHGEDLVAAKTPGVACATFTDANRPNLGLSTQLETNTQAVRIESLNGLFYKVHQGDYDRPMDLFEDLRRWTAAVDRGNAHEDDFPRLQDWVQGLNRNRDQRPAWVTTFAAVSPHMARRAWAARLRDALGLAHIAGSATAQHPIVLLQYPLQRVFDAHRAAPGWAAIPTVFDDVPGSAGINHVFFPPARSEAAQKMGAAVDLDGSENLDMPEFLHARIDYQLGDFRRVALISSQTADAQVAAARSRHLGKHRTHFLYAGDLPV